MTTTLHRAPARLDRIARECLVEAAQSLQGHALTVSEQLAGDLPDYPMDAPRIKEAVVCLLEESIRLAAANSRLRLTVKAGRHGLMLSVKAPGPGIDPLHEKDAVPERAAGIAAAHGGRVWANGAVGRGVTFYLTLPIPPTS
ncbi:MAG: hypothetical protein ACREAA_00205 [Candidatus Polarisedimenticolia bacterium]